MQTFKTAYLYCPETGRFLNEILCFYDPMTKQYPLPSFATFSTPPSSSSFFNGKRWIENPSKHVSSLSPFKELVKAHPLEELVEALIEHIIGRPEKLLRLSLKFHCLEEEMHHDRDA